MSASTGSWSTWVPTHKDGPPSNAIGYRVAYVSSVTDIETGGTIPIAGGAVLSIQVNAPAHDDELRPTYDPDDRLNAVKRRRLQDLPSGGLHGQPSRARPRSCLECGAGSRSGAFVLDGPGDGARLVIDIAHRW